MASLKAGSRTKTMDRLLALRDASGTPRTVNATNVDPKGRHALGQGVA